jgi:soluble cytochrome b562
MLGATQKQLYKTDDSGGITGFQPYKAFGGTYDASGKMTGYDAGKALAGFTPAQQQAQQGIMGLQVPGQYGAATNLTNQAALGSMNAAGQAGNLQNQALGYGTAGAQYGGAGAQYGSTGAEQAQRAAALTAAQAGQYGAQGAQAGQQAGNLSDIYGGLGSQAGQTAAGQSGMYGNLGAQSGQQYAGQSSGYGGMGAGYGAQGSQIGQSLGQMSQDPNAVQNYMNPYLQASLNPQLAEIQRQYDITGTQQRSGAAKSGAFGGSREALMSAENQRNAGLAKNQLIGQGYNQAFQQAQQQMNAANQAALSGNAQAMQGAGIGLQGAGQAGSQALAGYGMGLQGAGQAGSQAMQGYGMGLTGANQAGNLRMQGAQAGLQGVGAQQAAANLGLAGTAQGMQGAGMGMQGAQAGMQGVQGAIGAGQYGLSGLGQAGQMAGQLAGIGGQQLAAQQGILTAQNAVGAQQQQLEQQKINQAIQDYANAQQYPIMQLGTMSNMLRGLPMQAQTTQQYQAQANPITQGIGALGAGASLYNATKPAAKGGIMSYDVGGSVRAKLEDMPDESLKAQLKSSSSESIKNDIKQILATRSMAGVKQAAKGGVLRYAEPNKENNQGVTTSGPLTDAAARADYKELYPGQHRDDAMYQKIGNYISPTGPLLDAPTRVLRMVRDNVVSPVVRGVRDFVNKDPAIQAIEYGYGKENKKDFFVTPEQRERDAANIQTVRDNRVEQIVNPDGKTPLNPKSILAANPTGTSPAGTTPAKTSPAGAAPASVASSDGTGKVSKEKIDQIRKTNPEFNAAMGNNTPDSVSSSTQNIMDMISKNLGISPKPPVDENAGMSTAQILARDEKIAKEFAGENPAMARRTQIMAEKNSALNDAKYTQAMRMAEFFAMWGSTPGNTIVAGLNAMKAKIPDFITDKKEATKIRRDIDKSIADLDQIDYLEKVGKIDAADKKRTASIKFGIDTWGTQITKATALTGIVAREIGDTERNTATIAGRSKDAVTQANATRDAARIRGEGTNTGIKDFGTIQRGIKGLIEEERKLRDGPLKADLRFVDNKAAILKNDPKRAEDIAEREKRIKEQLEPIIRQRKQLEEIAASMAPVQNLPGQASSNIDPSKRVPINSFYSQ